MEVSGIEQNAEKKEEKEGSLCLIKPDMRAFHLNHFLQMNSAYEEYS